jgi:hypothetical protein
MASSIAGYNLATSPYRGISGLVVYEANTFVAHFSDPAWVFPLVFSRLSLPWNLTFQSIGCRRKRCLKRHLPDRGSGPMFSGALF